MMWTEHKEECEYGSRRNREVQEKRIEDFKRKETLRTREEEHTLQSIYLVLQGCLKTKSTDLKMRL